MIQLDVLRIATLETLASQISVRLASSCLGRKKVQNLDEHVKTAHSISCLAKVQQVPKGLVGDECFVFF